MKDPLEKIRLISVGDDANDYRRHAVLAELYASDSQIHQRIEELDCGSLPDGPTLIRLLGEAGREGLAAVAGRGATNIETAMIGYADGIIFTKQNEQSGDHSDAQVLSVIPAAVQAEIAQSKVEIDLHGVGLIIGAVSLARAMAAGIARLGLKKIIIVDPIDEAASALVDSVSRHLLGVQIEVLSRYHLTQLPSEASIAINLISAIDDSVLEEPFLEDIAYMNYMMPHGLWLDWTNAATQKGLSEEIMETGVVPLSSERIRTRCDAHLLAKVTGHKAEQIFATVIEKLGDSPVSCTD